MYIHWQMVSPKIKIPKVRTANYPVKLKDMIDPEIYHQDVSLYSDRVDVVITSTTLLYSDRVDVV